MRADSPAGRLVAALSRRNPPFRTTLHGAGHPVGLGKLTLALSRRTVPFLGPTTAPYAGLPAARETVPWHHRLVPVWTPIVAAALTALVALIPYYTVLKPHTPPGVIFLDCATGKLTLTGSTAFRPVVQEAANTYADTCPGASFNIDTRGSDEGLRRLVQAGKENGSRSPDQLAFFDGPKPDGFPQLLPRPIAVSLFTLVINKGAGVQDLSQQQIAQLFQGRIANWKDVGGNDLPVRLVDRYTISGTRSAFEMEVLKGREPGATSDDCRTLRSGAPPGVIRCARDSTPDVLDEVARIPGAIGYSEFEAAYDRQEPNLVLVRIDGYRATLKAAKDGDYSFWGTEYAYTYGQPLADSLAASFLRYLTSGIGRDIVRSHGHYPCAEVQNPVLCRPT